MQYMARIINIDTASCISSTIGNETRQFSNIGKVISYEINFSNSDNLAFTVKEVDEIWKRKW